MKNSLIKKLAVTALSLAMLLSMSGCGHGHSWTDASCTAPKTCTVCGATEGDVLTPDFVTYDIQLAELGKTYDLVWPYSEAQPDEAAVIHVSVSGYRVFESDYGLPAKEGYEYREVTFKLVFGVENASEYCEWHSCWEDYYDIKLHDDSAGYTWDEASTYKLNFNGQEMEEQVMGSTGWSWSPPGTANEGFTACIVSVPVGYDGFVLGIYNDTVKWPEGGYIYDIYDPDMFFMFRLA